MDIWIFNTLLDDELPGNPQRSFFSEERILTVVENYPELIYFKVKVSTDIWDEE
jgi:hypothetical protein